MQVSNWNEKLNDIQRAENYRNRLFQEMTINQETLMSRQESFAKQIEYGLFAVDSTEPITKDNAWKLVHAYFQASHSFTISLKQGTYDEIINSGDLALLKDQKLVNALGEFYSFSGLSTIDVIPAYRENIRRIIPFQLQKYLQKNCYKVIPPETHLLLDCPPPVEFNGLIELATTIRANNDIKQDLTYMLSYSGVSIAIAQNLNEKVDNILTFLSNNISSNTKQ